MSQSMSDEGTQSKPWVDFKLIKESVTMEMLLIQYGIADVQRQGNEVRGACPFHASKSKTSFSVNLEKNTFCCFATNCKARGNVLDFVAKMEGCTVRDAALKLDEMFKITEQETSKTNGNHVAVHNETNTRDAPGKQKPAHQPAVQNAMDKITAPTAGECERIGESESINETPLPYQLALIEKVSWLEKKLAVIEQRLFYIEMDMATRDTIDAAYTDT